VADGVSRLAKRRAELSVERKRPRGSRSASPEGKHTHSPGELVEADEGALLQCGAVLSDHWHDIGADTLGQHILSPDLNDTRAAPGSRNPDMLIFSMISMTIQVRGRGTLTLPTPLREKYRLGEGDPLTVVDLDGAVLLSPRVLVVPRLAAEMERLRRARKLSLKDLGSPARED
jgi:bifunctional DNA-binding transcriptional regulator/antitoxin component of YhaV-PrlF toxin-antitoxin module